MEDANANTFAYDENNFISAGTMMNILRIYTVFCVLAFLSACGGGGDSSNSNSNDANTQQGRFVDSPVSGLFYISSVQQGLTDGAGYFNYQDGDVVAFYIGSESGIYLGEAAGSDVIMPRDLVPSDSGENIAINIARLLIGLDSDGDSSNGIQISSTSVQAAFTLGIDQSAFDMDPDNFPGPSLQNYVKEQILDEGRELPNSEYAQVHMNCSEQDVSAGREPDGQCDIGNDNDNDFDGILNTADNCPNVANADQSDDDSDGVGNACDIDRDGDGVNNSIDNCPNMANPDQADADGDQIGDVCDTGPVDSDSDGIIDGKDNCPNVANSNQRDRDTDGQGDVCDSDLDGDGVANNNDNCPNTANANQTDTDGDGVGDLCDSNTDSDGDGVSDNLDNCPADANAGQEDGDGDGIGDACDTVDDNEEEDSGLLCDPSGEFGCLDIIEYLGDSCDSPENFSSCFAEAQSTLCSTFDAENTSGFCGDSSDPGLPFDVEELLGSLCENPEEFATCFSETQQAMCSMFDEPNQSGFCGDSGAPLDPAELFGQLCTEPSKYEECFSSARAAICSTFDAENQYGFCGDESMSDTAATKGFDEVEDENGEVVLRAKPGVIGASADLILFPARPMFEPKIDFAWRASGCNRVQARAQVGRNSVPNEKRGAYVATPSNFQWEKFTWDSAAIDTTNSLDSPENAAAKDLMKLSPVHTLSAIADDIPTCDVVEIRCIIYSDDSGEIRREYCPASN